MRDRPLEKPCDDVGSELVKFCVEKGTEEPCSPSDIEPRVSQNYSLFVTDELGTKFSCIFYGQGLEALEESLPIALA